MSSPEITEYPLSNGAAKPRKTSLKRAAAKLKDKAATLQTTAGDAAHEAKVYADRAIDSLSTFSRGAVEKAKERPALSALTILGVGVAVGATAALLLRKPTSSFANTALDEAQRLRRKLPF